MFLRDVTAKFQDLNTNCSSAAKGTDFKCHLNIPRDSLDMTPYKISGNESWPESRDPIKFTWQTFSLSLSFLVNIIIVIIIVIVIIIIIIIIPSKMTR